MHRPEGYPERVPQFATEEEERDFWDTHSSAPYFDEGEDVTHNPPPELKRGPDRGGSRAQAARRGAQHGPSVATPAQQLIAAQEVVARRHLPYQSLMRSWIAERLEQEQRAR